MTKKKAQKEKVKVKKSKEKEKYSVSTEVKIFLDVFNRMKVGKNLSSPWVTNEKTLNLLKELKK